MVTVLQLVVKLALPLSILVAAVIIGAIWMSKRRADSELPWSQVDWRRVMGFALAALSVFIGYRALRVLNPIATEAILWEQSAEATETPSDDAPAVYQFGPTVSSLARRTYTRTLSIPPYLLERIGTEGIGMLAPYLSDPTAEGVTSLVDTFRRSGQELILTREVTRLDEDPIPFSNSNVTARFVRKQERAYDVEFEGRYEFGNTGNEPMEARFVFALPYEGTIRDLAINVGDEAVDLQNDAGNYEWRGRLLAGDKRTAVVKYTVSGSRVWHYDIGSRRRRVEEFTLTANTGGPAKFMRGSLQPTEKRGDEHTWRLSNVVTAQQVAVSFPPNIARRDAYLQALAVVPAGFIVFAVSVIVVAISSGVVLGPARFLLALFGFALGLGSIPVLSPYLGSVAAVLVGPLIGAGLAVFSLGSRALLPGLVAGLLPAAFLSAEHSGLILLVLGVVAFLGLLVQRGRAAGARV